jgi:RNA polymerase sigma-70 factor, ECF subfamily
MNRPNQGELFFRKERREMSVMMTEQTVGLAVNEIWEAEATDEQLLIDYRETGNRAAFDELVHRYERELFNYLRRYLGNSEMAEDAFQGTFLHVHLKCDQFQSNRKLRPWLYTIATHQAIDLIRKNRRHKMASLSQTGGPGSSGDMPALSELIPDNGQSPFERLQVSEQRRQVETALNRLPDYLRQTVLLVYYQGLKYREVASVMDVPEGTVKSRMHAAIRKLGNLLSSQAA